MMERDAMYAKDMAGYIRYRKQIYSEITNPTLLTLIVLQERFWPMSNWQWNHTCSMSSFIGADVSPDTSLRDDPEP